MTADLASRAKIITSATELFADRGLDGVSVRDIAQHADVNLALISYYFGGKEKLYVEVIREFAMQAQDQITHIFEPQIEKKLSPEHFESSMRRLIDAFLSTMLLNPRIFMLLQREVLSGLPYCRDIHESIFETLVERVVSYIKAAQKKKIVSSEINPYLLFFALVHTCESFVMGHRCETNLMKKMPSLPDKKNELVDQLYKIFIQGALK